jgi:hypothetical protein
MNVRAKAKGLTISFYLHLRFFHLLEKFRITNHTSSIPNFSASFVQARDDPNNCPLRNIR